MIELQTRFKYLSSHHLVTQVYNKNKHPIIVLFYMYGIVIATCTGSGIYFPFKTIYF